MKRPFWCRQGFHRFAEPVRHERHPHLWVVFCKRSACDASLSVCTEKRDWRLRNFIFSNSLPRVIK